MLGAALIGYGRISRTNVKFPGDGAKKGMEPAAVCYVTTDRGEQNVHKCSQCG